MSTIKSIAIVADGDFPSHPVPLHKLTRAEVVIACDGAAETLAANGFVADYIVGDMDTLSPARQQEYRNKIHKIAEQESNDLTKSFRFALGLLSGCTGAEINILGAGGKREDHTVANISLLADYQKQAPKGVCVKAFTDYGVFAPFWSEENKPLIIREIAADITPVKGPVSIFAFDTSLRITSQGLEYQTSGVTFDMWWKATLNSIAREDATLTLSHPSPILLYFPYRNSKLHNLNK